MVVLDTWIERASGRSCGTSHHRREQRGLRGPSGSIRDANRRVHDLNDAQRSHGQHRIGGNKPRVRDAVEVCIECWRESVGRGGGFRTERRRTHIQMRRLRPRYHRHPPGRLQVAGVASLVANRRRLIAGRLRSAPFNVGWTDGSHRIRGHPRNSGSTRIRCDLRRRECGQGQQRGGDSHAASQQPCSTEPSLVRTRHHQKLLHDPISRLRQLRMEPSCALPSDKFHSGGRETRWKASLHHSRKLVQFIWTLPPSSCGRQEAKKMTHKTQAA